MQMLNASFRITAATMLTCVAGYTLVMLGVAQVVTPVTANGSLIERADGVIVGSRLIAQNFVAPRYFWPRPSACGYNAAGAAGSNKSPASPDLSKRAAEWVARHGATPENPLPADLAAASGCGLDPHITLRAARYQAGRVADARGLATSQVLALIEKHTFSPGGRFTTDRLVNVLELNLALDSEAASVLGSR